MSRRRRVLLLVDLSYQCYRASAAHPTLRDSEGRFTGGLFGFFHTVAKIIRETEATDIAICQDVKPYLRSVTYPEYKQLRKKSLDEDLARHHRESMGYIIGALQQLGIYPWGLKGYEADDMAAWAVLRHRHRFDRIYAASNDSDLWQLFWVPNFASYGKDLRDVWNGERLMRVHGLTPDEYMLATALMGTHNDIAGIAKVGEVTSRKAVKDPALMRTLMAQHSDLIRRNVSLITLPHPDFPGAYLPAIGESTSRDIYRALGRYDIEVTGAIVDAFAQLQPRPL